MFVTTGGDSDEKGSSLARDLSRTASALCVARDRCGYSRRSAARDHLQFAVLDAESARSRDRAKYLRPKGRPFEPNHCTPQLALHRCFVIAPNSWHFIHA